MGKGYYILMLELRRNTPVKVGGLGTFSFSPGLYCYIGRAIKGLKKRIIRHFLQGHPKRWHIDYLIPFTTPVGVLLFPLREGISECNLAQTLRKLGGQHFPPHFGASDCRCPGHLLFFPTPNPHQLLMIANSLRHYPLPFVD